MATTASATVNAITMQPISQPRSPIAHPSVAPSSGPGHRVIARMRIPPDELTEIGRLFRAKLRQQREQERPRARASKRRSTVAPRARLTTVESSPDDCEVLSSSQLALLL